jgi:glycosyltransferase 2 family protein
VAFARSDAERHSVSDPDSGDPGLEAEVARPVTRVLRVARVVVGIVLFGLVVFAAVRSWDDVRTTLARIGPVELVLAEVLVLAGLGASVLTWRVVLRELGSMVNLRAASKIYLVGQLGKFLPGSAWALALQMELAKQANVPRARSLAASVIAIGVNAATGLAIGLVVVPRVVSGGAWRTITLVALVSACAVGLSPPVLTRLVNVGLRIARRGPVQREVTWRGMLTAIGWAVASFTCYGLSVWVLAVSVGAPAGESLPLCLAGVAFAMTIGALIVVAPSGIGVREAVIVAALAPVLERPEALAIALVARLLFVLADLIAAAATLPVRLREPDVSSS